MKVDARLTIPGEISWVSPGAEDKVRGFAMRGTSLNDLDLLYDGVVIGQLLQWPSAHGDRMQLFAGTARDEFVVLETQLECSIDMEAFIRAAADRVMNSLASGKAPGS